MPGNLDLVEVFSSNMGFTVKLNLESEINLPLLHYETTVVTVIAGEEMLFQLS